MSMFGRERRHLPMRLVAGVYATINSTAMQAIRVPVQMSTP